jgi:hypothetical protein
MKKITLSLISLLVITFSSCSEMAKEFKFMNEIRDEISKKYETNQVEINLQNKTKLIVTISDPKFKDFSSERKETISKKIGTLVKRIGKDRELINSGVVKFVVQKSYGVAKTSKSDIYDMY